jgi:hypothetical protein
MNRFILAEYRVDGKLHCANGPAISYDKGFDSEQFCIWYLHGKAHRYYGSVIDDSHAWVIHGVRIK